ncbi:MAG TPA: hypothetical protein VM933_06495, partial [Acidimicrobiales bacterium]|nr:hypothetical protein [Acidimicrobiales bacterium]
MDIIGRRWFARRKRKQFTAVATIIALIATLASVHLSGVPAGATDATTVQQTFELEGNPQDVDPGPPPQAPEDWSTLLSASANNNLVDVGDDVFRIAQTQVPIPDPEATDVTYYKGGGSKDERDISGSGQTWLHSATDVAPDKNSILNAAAVAYQIPDGPDGTTSQPETNPDHVLNFSLDRLANDGDAVVGFWFFKNRVGLSSTDSQAFTGTHAVGDLLVVSDFSGG